MAEVQVLEYLNGTSLVLTTDSPASHYGMPALRHEGCARCADMGPGDMMPICAEPESIVSLFGPCTAADVVRGHDWRRATTQQMALVEAFLRQGVS